MIKIYTLGTSNCSIDDFLEILKSYQIQTVIDVRRWPTSKWFEHFKKENLEKTLPENNIQYLHFEKLGGYRTGGYEEYIKTKEFKEALEELLKISESQNTVLICAEKLPWTPHPPPSSPSARHLPPGLYLYYLCRKITVEMSSSYHS